MQFNTTGVFPSLLILMSLLSVYSCSSGDSMGEFVPIISINNCSYDNYAIPTKELSLEKMVIISDSSGYSGFDLIGVAIFDSLVVLVDEKQGVFSLGIDGKSKWNIGEKELGLSLLTPIIYTSFDRSRGEICTVTAEKKKMVCFSIFGEIVNEIDLPVSHDNAMKIGNGKVLLETFLHYPSGKQNGKSFMLSVFKGGSIIKGHRECRNRNSGDVKYAFNYTISKNNDFYYFSRPFRDTVYEITNDGQLVAPVVSYKFQCRHPLSSLFADKSVKNAIEEFSEKNYAQPSWVRFINNKLFTNYDYGGQNFFAISSQDTTLINTNVLNFSQSAIMAPNFPGNDGYFYSFYSLRKHRVLQMLKEIDFIPNDDVLNKLNQLYEPVDGVREPMVLVQTKALK